MSVYGYCRVSTRSQKMERQISAVKGMFPEAVIITDKTTGRNFNRNGWQKLYKKLEEGDTVVFDEVSRMSRNAKEGFAIYQELFEKGVNLVFIAEPHINTSEYRDALRRSISFDVSSGDKATDEFINSIMQALNTFMMAKVKSDIQKAFDKSQGEVDSNSRRTSKALQEKIKRNKELMVMYPDNYKNHPDWRQIGQDKGKKLTTKKSFKAKEIIIKHSKDFNGTLKDEEVIKLADISRNTYYKYKRELQEAFIASVTSELHE